MLTTPAQIAAQPDFILQPDGLPETFFADNAELESAIEEAQAHWDRYEEEIDPDYSCKIDCTAEPECMEQYHARGIRVGVLNAKARLLIVMQCVESKEVGGRLVKTFEARVVA